ncbi:MAG TPA: TraC family protein [Patescibacteria group bacterium]|nr:TraC family protein [Patescibacteria group bacterium]
MVLPENKYRVVVETSAINFELKSEAEQDALIDNFQNFINALPCPIQILIRVREVEIDNYLEVFNNKNNHETNKLYRQQIKHYGQFVKQLVKGSKILSRRFYLVIPYEPEPEKNDFNLVKEQINLSLDIISKGLERLGMKTRSLNTLEILELFYSFYNPGVCKTQPIKEKTYQLLSKNKDVIQTPKL